MIISFKSLEKLTLFVFVVFCLFPYVRIIPLPTDAQPNALVAATLLLIFVFVKKRLSIGIVGLYILIITGFAVGAAYQFIFSFDILRSLFNYISLILISATTIFLYRSGFRLPEKYFRWTVYIYFIVGMIQSFVSPRFLGFFLYQLRTSTIRGSTSLTPEPGFSATMAVLFLIFYLLNYYPKKANSYIILFAIWIIVLAKSATIVLVCIVSLATFMLIKRPIKFLIIGGLGLFVTYILFTNIINQLSIVESNRLFRLVNFAFENPAFVFYVDGSVNERFSFIFMAFYLSFVDNLIPHGPNMNYYIDQIILLRDNGTFPWLFTQYGDSTGFQFNRILSSWGMLIYECGIFGLMFIAYFHLKGVVKFYSNGPRLLALIFFFFLLFNGTSFTTAFIPFLIGNMLFLTTYNGQKESNEFFKWHIIK